MRSLVSFVALSLCTLSPFMLSAQNTEVVVQPMQARPVYRVDVVARTVESVNYRHRASTKIDFRGTSLMPEARGHAKVESKAGRMAIRADLDNLRSPTSFGPEYLTYVLWAITPEGRPVNLGEVIPDHNQRFHIDVTVNLQNFGMIVTAEPYFAVTRPSNMTVLENILRTDTKGWEQPVTARYQATERGEYTVDLASSKLPVSTMSPGELHGTPLPLLEARDAVAIAQASGAQQYAPEVMARAADMLQRADAYYAENMPFAAIATASKGATEAAEDARVLSIRKKDDERIAAERKAAEERAELAQREAQNQQQQAMSAREAQEQAEQNAKQAQAQAQQEREAAEQARAEAGRAQAEAQQAQQQADAAREAAKAQQDALAAQAQAAQEQAEAARKAAETAEQQAQAAQQQRDKERQQLLAQLNQVMQTRETARGLIVSMNDVLFDFNKATLKPGAKVRLAKIAGILQTYPDLRLQLEGYTDSIGTPEYNQELSERRAIAVRDFLISQGVKSSSVSAQGFGEENPVATNKTAEGRQMNRRVDLVVNGEAIAEQPPQAPSATAPAMSQPVGSQQQSLPQSEQQSPTPQANPLPPDSESDQP